MARLDQLNERALALAVTGFLLLTPPILLIFNRNTEIWGIPVLYFYAFAIWALLIILGRLLTAGLIKSERVQTKKTGAEIASPRYKSPPDEKETS